MQVLRLPGRPWEKVPPRFLAPVVPLLASASPQLRANQVAQEAQGTGGANAATAGTGTGMCGGTSTGPATSAFSLTLGALAMHFGRLNDHASS